SMQITRSPHWFSRPRSPKDSDRKDWKKDYLTVHFGFPSGDLRGGRELLDNRLPLLRTWWLDGTLLYEQRAILDALRGGDVGTVDVDDPTLMLVEIRVTNVGNADAAAH